MKHHAEAELCCASSQECTLSRSFLKSEISLSLQPDTFKEDGQKAVAAFKEWVEGGANGAPGWQMESENHEGWRVAVDEGDGKAGWLLLRSSLHDPLLVLNVESDTPNGEHHRLFSSAFSPSLLANLSTLMPSIQI